MIRLKDNNERHGRRKVMSPALVLLILFVSIIILSTVFLVMHANHDCIGVQCHICVIIKNVKSMLEHFGRAIAITLLPGTLLTATMISFTLRPFVILPSTLLDEEVKLNN